MAELQAGDLVTWSKCGRDMRGTLSAPGNLRRVLGFASDGDVYTCRNWRPRDGCGDMGDSHTPYPAYWFLHAACPWPRPSGYEAN